MEQAFVADRVDLSIMGDWEDVQIDLGLLEERLTPSDYGNWGDWEEIEPQLQQLSFETRKMNKEKAKRKRKTAKNSRKKNRKRKR
jgi:hypothetical protein